MEMHLYFTLFSFFTKKDYQISVCRGDTLEELKIFLPYMKQIFTSILRDKLYN